MCNPQNDVISNDMISNDCTARKVIALHFTRLTYSASDSLRKFGRDYLSLVRAFGEEIEVWARD
jgi:hypothetical protein